MRKHARLPLAVAALASAAIVAGATAATAPRQRYAPARAAANGTPTTPIRHVVVIFGENVSFDHYFGTYPRAANTDGKPFQAAPGTPAVDGLSRATGHHLPRQLRHKANLLTDNPNSSLPQRLDSSATGLEGDAGGQLTCDQNHDYSEEQQAFDEGKMDHFVQSVGNGGGTSPFGTKCQASTVMDYFDGNTVSALWSYAQQYAMSDNSYGTTFGPSAPGAINLVAGNTGGVDTGHEANSPTVATPTAPAADLAQDGSGGYSLIGDAQPYWDDCSTRDAVALTGQNIGDELNAAGLSWGWFQGGQRPTTSFAEALVATKHEGQLTSEFIPDEFKSAGFEKAVAHSSNQGLCDAVHPVGVALGGSGQWHYKDDYIPHHEPFDYYASTANPHHLTIATDEHGIDTLAGLEQIGTDTQTYKEGVPQFDTPNHNYDTSDFEQLVAAISAEQLPASALPAVSFLKAPGYQDAHAAYSDPADEEAFVTREIGALMQSPDWSSTAVVIAYDDSDGWYDHAFSGISNPSLSAPDNLTGTTFSGATSGKCGPDPQTASPLAGEQGRCGLGPRLPLLVISPFARTNHVDHNLSSQSSVLNLIEYNWRLPAIAGSADQLLAGSDRAEGIPFDLAGMFAFGHGHRHARIVHPRVSRSTAGG